jgi:hypothetical protein
MKAPCMVSNPQPALYKRAALTFELMGQKHSVGFEPTALDLEDRASDPLNYECKRAQEELNL